MDEAKARELHDRLLPRHLHVMWLAGTNAVMYAYVHCVSHVCIYACMRIHCVSACVHIDRLSACMHTHCVSACIHTHCVNACAFV